MSMLKLFKASAPAAVDEPTKMGSSVEPLEDIIMDLAKWGRPSLMQHRDGDWSCGVEVNVTPVGAKFDVRSDFKHGTPSEAAAVCRDRLLKALDALGGKT